MIFKEEQYIGFDGLRMHMSSWIPDDEKPRALLIAVHGLGSHGYTLKNIGEYFVKRGIAVFAPDMRGFGHYSGVKGHVMSFDEYIEDMFNLVMQIKDRFLNKLVFLFGHSLGGQHVIRYVSTYPKAVDGIILSCPNISQTLNIGIGKRIAGEILSVLNIKRYFSSNMDQSFSSHDPEFIKEINEDPLMFNKVTARFGIQGLKAMKRAFKVARFITLPALVQQAGDDKFVDPDKTKAFFDTLASPDKTWRFYEGFYHSLHNELEKDRVLSDMETWLERRLPS